MKLRPLSPRLLTGLAATLLITACGDATETSRGSAPGAQALELQRMQQSLEQSHQALAVNERRVAALRGEQNQDRRRIADLTARTVELERRNRELGQHLTQARSQLAQSNSAQSALRRQSDYNAQQAHALGKEHQTLRLKLASAYNEIHKLQARQLPDQRQIADLYQRGTAAARELDELRRYNGFLLQERSNLQAWLQEAHATRAGQQEAVQRSMDESKRIKAQADAVSGRLRAKLDEAEEKLTALETTRDRLSRETHSLRAMAAEAVASQRAQSDQLQKALAHAGALAEANERMASELQNSQSDPSAEAAALHAELDQAGAKITRLRAANDYLTEKVEACSVHKGSADTGPVGPPRLIAVANHGEEKPANTRRERELAETKKKVEKLEREQQALAKTLQERESECEAAKKQVQTLTWANEVLVKELDAAYATGKPGTLPKGTRGIYVLRSGESLSRVAKAFYGDAARWKDIVAANEDKIPDPNKVEAGTVIQIPE